MFVNRQWRELPNGSCAMNGILPILESRQFVWTESFLHLAPTGVILCLPMLAHWRHRTALLLLLAYVSTGALVAVSHHDYTDLFFHQSARLTSHDCGSNEIHVPLDKRHECLACTQTTMRIATAVSPTCVQPAQFVCFCCAVFTIEHTSHPGILHSGKRGPPIFS